MSNSLKKLVSIIIPIYNCEEYISRSIESIVNQSYSTWELILIDDGSKDNSYNICKEYAEVDKRIKVFKQENQGAGPARNKGLDYSTGEYIMFVDSDDFFEENAIKTLICEQEKIDADLVIGNYNFLKVKSNSKIFKYGAKDIKEEIIIDESKVKEKYIELFKLRLITAPWGKLFKAKIIKENNIRFESLRRNQDIVFNVMYYGYIKSLIICPEIVYNYYICDREILSRKIPKNMFEIIKYRDNCMSLSLQKWNVYDNKAKVYLANLYLVGISEILRMNATDKWKLSKIESDNINNKVINDERTIEALKIYENSSSGKGIKGIYNNLFYYSIKKKRILLIKVLSKVGEFVRVKILFRIKERLNGK